MEKLQTMEKLETDTSQLNFHKIVKERGPLVLFIGNGIRRVPSKDIRHYFPEQFMKMQNQNPTNGIDQKLPSGVAGPSWQEYLRNLYAFVDICNKSMNEPELELSFDAFSQLSFPRQAEWFDSLISHILDVRESPSLLRMHLLGVDLHPHQAILTNEIVLKICEVAFSDLSRSNLNGEVSIITTNVDCILEQNIAAMNDLKGLNLIFEINVYGNVDKTAVWRKSEHRAKTSRPKDMITVNIYKLHGCLGAQARLTETLWSQMKDQMRTRPLASSPAYKAGLEKKVNGQYCGETPREYLWDPNDPSFCCRWVNIHNIVTANNQNTSDVKSRNAVFSSSEYMELLAEVLKNPGPNTILGKVMYLYEKSPMIFIGYEFHDVDIDILIALQKTQQNQHRYTLRMNNMPIVDAKRDREKFRQLGISVIWFSLGPLGISYVPGKLGVARRHEWRCWKGHNFNDESAWTIQLQHLEGREWTEKIVDKLNTLIFTQNSQMSIVQESKLVFAGLASIMHSFSVQKPGDFPMRRRISARLEAVDTHVPNGSGLVPVIVAAVLGGPQYVGSFVFLTNVPDYWQHWKEINEFCLSGGVEIKPSKAATAAESASARTSHVILFDTGSKENEPKSTPRQRMIMDVDQTFDRRGVVHRQEKDISKVIDGYGFEDNTHNFLFADKLADISLLNAWKGPLVYETGSSGVDLLEMDVKATIWTASFGSMIRSTVYSYTKDTHSWKSIEDGEALLQTLPNLEPLLKLDHVHYIVQRLSFLCCPSLNEKVDHNIEVEFGLKVMKDWYRIGRHLLQMFNTNVVFNSNFAELGRGVLYTLHEHGMMSYWESSPGKFLSIVIWIHTADRKIEPDWDTLTFQIECLDSEECAHISNGKRAILRIPNGDENIHLYPATLSINGEEFSFASAEHKYRNSLCAGDSVRGCLSIGLWSYLNQTGDAKPRSIPDIIFASCVLASMKCYVGSLINFLSILDQFRGTSAWYKLWSFGDSRTDFVCGSSNHNNDSKSAENKPVLNVSRSQIITPLQGHSATCNDKIQSSEIDINHSDDTLRLDIIHDRHSKVEENETDRSDNCVDRKEGNPMTPTRNGRVRKPSRRSAEAAEAIEVVNETKQSKRRK